MHELTRWIDVNFIALLLLSASVGALIGLVVADVVCGGDQ